MYNLVSASIAFSMQSLSAYDLMLALVFIASSAILGSMGLILLLQREENPKRKLQKRLQLLAAMGADTACQEGSFAGEGKGSSNALGKASSTAGIVGKFLIGFRQALNKLSTVPVLRIFVKPLATRLEKQKVQALRDSCMNDLPEMVDILSLSLGAGLSIDQAFEWYLSSYDTPLAGEFRRAEQAYQVGMLSRMKAFEELAQDLQEEAVLRFVNALRQAFALGSALGPALDTLSQDVRKYRVSRIEEKIAKTPVKILAPLGLCIVPAVLILLMGPIMSQVLQGLQF